VQEYSCRLTLSAAIFSSADSIDSLAAAFQVFPSHSGHYVCHVSGGEPRESIAPKLSPSTHDRSPSRRTARKRSLCSLLCCAVTDPERADTTFMVHSCQPLSCQLDLHSSVECSTTPILQVIKFPPLNSHCVELLLLLFPPFACSAQLHSAQHTSVLPTSLLMNNIDPEFYSTPASSPQAY
jgi:hypothetical protein